MMIVMLSKKIWMMKLPENIKDNMINNKGTYLRFIQQRCDYSEAVNLIDNLLLNVWVLLYINTTLR